MEMERREVEAIVKRRHTILEKASLLEKGIKILDPEGFMWTHTKHNYDKHMEWMEN
jgi:hypothetical protein